MKVLGIIAEYNPFHLGHLYHLNQSKALLAPDYTVAVLSGNFTQRGEAAITDKWVRTEMALQSGVDLVLELPAVYAVQSAERFAWGGIQVLNHTGCVTHVSFGSELGDLAPLRKAAKMLNAEDSAFSALLQKHLKSGVSYPAARLQALKDCMQDDSACGESDILHRALSSPNSILGIEYVRALNNTGSTIEPMTIPRKQAGYHDREIQRGISSATAVRQEYFANGFSDPLSASVPPCTLALLQKAFQAGRGPVRNEHLEGILLAVLRRASLKEIRSWPDIGEGLEHRISKCARAAQSLEDFLAALKTKRYVYTRLQRMMIHGLLGLTEEALSCFTAGGGPAYLRVLGFAADAAPLLKHMKGTARVPVITKGAHIRRQGALAQEMFAFDRLATDLYVLAYHDPSMKRGGWDYTQGPVIRQAYASSL